MKYTPSKIKLASQHPLAEKFIAERKIWATRWSKQDVSVINTEELAYRAVSLAELQALAGDAQYEPLLVEMCDAINGLGLKDITAETLYVNNPEPVAIRLARTARLIPAAGEIMCDLLYTMLDRLETGTHGWPHNYGKSSMCRVAIQRALGVPCDTLSDYGASRGLNWTLDNIITPDGWNLSMFGSPWYQMFNDPIVDMGWDVRRQLTPERLAKFNAVYKMPWYWQANGKAPLVGEDRDQNRVKSYPIWAGYARRWRGTDRMSHYMRHLALTTLGVPTHFDDLFCPTVPAWTVRPSLPAVSAWPEIALIARESKRDTVVWLGNTKLSFKDSHHEGEAKATMEVILKG